MTSEELRQANHIKISTVNASSSQLPHRNWPFPNGSTSINLPTTFTIIPSTKNLSSNTLCAIGTLQRGNQVLYLRRVPSVGIVVPCEGIDQRTKNAAGKACHWALTHRIMLEHHTWRTRGIRSAGHFVEVWGDLLMDGWCHSSFSWVVKLQHCSARKMATKPKGSPR